MLAAWLARAHAVESRYCWRFSHTLDARLRWTCVLFSLRSLRSRVPAILRVNYGQRRSHSEDVQHSCKHALNRLRWTRLVAASTSAPPTTVCPPTRRGVRFPRSIREEVGTAGTGRPCPRIDHSARHARRGGRHVRRRRATADSKQPGRAPRPSRAALRQDGRVAGRRSGRGLRWRNSPPFLPTDAPRRRRIDSVRRRVRRK